MSMTATAFLGEIEQFLAKSATDPSTLGKNALGDPNFVFDLRNGRSPSTRTIDKVRGWISAQTPKPMVPGLDANRLTHLQKLEAESIHIIREVAAECEKPVMLYSIGKDSAVMLHLAMKAFYPAKPPFPLMHVDTTWKFRDMIELRDETAKKLGLDLIVYINPGGRRQERQSLRPRLGAPYPDHEDRWRSSRRSTNMASMPPSAARGATRKNPAPRSASSRSAISRHRWDPKNQRPELWNLYNARKNKGESIRVFPLSNWTELDIWQYIHRENIPIVPLYFAAERPVVWRDGQLIMVDDDRMRLNPGEKPEMKKIRFRTLGCYPLTGAIEFERHIASRHRRGNAGRHLLRTPGPRHRQGRRPPRWRRRSRKGISDDALHRIRPAAMSRPISRAQEKKDLLRFITCGSRR